MDIKEIKSIIESLLFIWGDPLEIKDIASILEISEKETENAMKELMDDLDYNMRGIKILKINNTYQFGTRPENYPWIKKLSTPKQNKNLSNASMETLSIIAYRQPIIKSDIEAIRGVKCDKAIETLTERGLIEEVGRLEKVGRPILYGTTELFLRAFGLESIANLPPLEEKQLESAMELEDDEE